MRKPSGRKEYFVVVVIGLIFVIDIIFAWYAMGYIVASFPPKKYSIVPSMGFAVPHTQDGYYDAAVMLNLTTPFFAGYQFTQGRPINVNVTASVYNGVFNDTRNQIYFSFQSAEFWQTKPTVGCKTDIRPPFGVNLTRFTTINKFTGQKLVLWKGAEDMCFLDQGNYEAIFTVVEPHKAPIVLRQNTGNISAVYSLPVEHPNTVQQYFFNRVDTFLGFSLLLLEVIGSGALMLDLWQWGFPPPDRVGRR